MTACAPLCHLAGGELDRIQFLLGHVSIQTTCFTTFFLGLAVEASAESLRQALAWVKEHAWKLLCAVCDGVLQDFDDRCEANQLAATVSPGRSP